MDAGLPCNVSKEMMMNQLRPLVRVIDDNELALRSMKVLLESEGMDVNVFLNSQIFFANEDFKRPGCIISEVRMPYMGGLALQAELNKMGIDIPMILVSGYGDYGFVEEAKRIGVRHFMQNQSETNHLVEAVREAIEINLETWNNQNNLPKADSDNQNENAVLIEFQKRAALLSPREREVTQLIVQGLSASEVAHQLGNSMKTVETIKYHSMKKLGVHRMADLIRLSTDADIFTLSEKKVSKVTKKELKSKTEQFVENLKLLSSRQREIIDLICLGKTTEQIAELLNLSPNSVKAHRRLAYGKLGVSTLRDLMRIQRNAYDMFGVIDGYVDPDKRKAEVQEFQNRLVTLSEKQRNIVDLLSLGASVKEIGQTLNTRAGTVHRHLYSVYFKLGVRGLQELKQMLKSVKQYSQD